MANRNDDIVKRLRDDCYECQEEAADEIERLRKQNRELLENHKLFMKECNKDIDALQSMLMKVREGNEDYFWVNPDLAKDCSRALTALIAERDAAIKHRDEARRMYLASACSDDDEIITLMKSMGWDCFKENTND